MNQIKTLKFGLLVRFDNYFLFKFDETSKNYNIPLFDVSPEENWLDAIKRVAKENYDLVVDSSIEHFWEDEENNIRYFKWKVNEKINFYSFKWISFEDILYNNVNLNLEEKFKFKLISFCDRVLTPEKLFKKSDRDLFSVEEEFITGPLNYLGKAGSTMDGFYVAKINENLRRHMEMLRRFKNSMDRSSKIMTCLTVVMIVLTIVIAILNFLLIKK